MIYAAPSNDSVARSGKPAYVPATTTSGPETKHHRKYSFNSFTLGG